MPSGTVPEELTLREQHTSRLTAVVQNRKSLKLWTLQEPQEARGPTSGFTNTRDAS